MSANLFASAHDDYAANFRPEREIMPHLEDLALRIKTKDRQQEEAEDTNYWKLIDRVLAYAASAEQHISEQQSRIRELENLSTTDELTGLANRRGLTEHLQRVISSARRHRETGIIAFVDMDYFKKINDRFGHDTGDKALKLVAQILVDNMRDTDFAARLSGDEFIFVLEKADIKHGKERAEKIRQAICSATITARGETISLSASIGVTNYDCESSAADLISAADKAMYLDKGSRRKGR